MATTYLYRTPASSGSVTTATMSAWVKRTAIGEPTQIFGGNTGSSSANRTKFGIEGDDKMSMQLYNSSSSYDWNSTRLLKDVGAWYHLVYVFDTTNGTAGDRVRFYCNGERITDFTNQTAIPLNAELKMNTTSDSIYIGARKTGSTINQMWNGVMSHVHFIDGTAYEASAFGSTDATTGVWTINTAPSVTYGTNGFFLKMQDSSNLDLDSGTNTFTNFTTSGTLTATEDNPSDNFCTLNSLNTTKSGTAPVFSNGNNTVVTGTSTADFGGSGTLGLKKGIWYFEGLVVTSGDDNLRSVFGITSRPEETARNNQEVMHNRYSYCWKGYLGQWWTMTSATNGSSNATNNDGYLSTYTNGDYIGIYFNLDNNKMLFTKNGTLERSGVAMSITAVADTDTGVYFPIYTDGHSGWSSSAKLNFGNGVFGTTALTGSEDSDWFRDAGGKGKFKYNPTQTIDSTTWNARAICTKNINTYG